jgi:lipopolysaccharide assembly outer membrane protein LptD (OstA)
MSFVIFLFLTHHSSLITHHYCYAQEKKEEPIIVNGDTVEYSTDAKEVTATGNVSVTYKGSKLTCQKLTVNTQTKDAEAEGNARLDDKKGVVEGTKIKYNFQTKTGTIIDSKFRANPYFGKADKTEKISDTEFMAKRGYFTSCNYDNPHYRIKSRRINVFPGDKIQTKDDIFYLGRAPLFYLPQYNHSLKDPIMHVQLMPGKKKDWGPYMLSAWRYKLTDNVSGRIYFDYRNKLGVAEGFGANYTTQQFGKGDFKYYYTQERSRFFNEGVPAEFQRYLIRWRHKWVIDKQTDLTSEYYKIVDSKRIIAGTQYNLLKDYFFREYEKDAQPLSYILVHHVFSYSSMDFLMQKRINRWYSQEEKLPEIKYSLPSLQLGETPFYFDNSSSYVNYNYKYNVPAPAADDTSTRRDVTYNKFDTTNKFSLPTKIAFINFTPFISGQEAYSDNDKNNYGATSTIVFSTGSDASTKFYRLFNIKSNFLSLDINNLRHIITPSIAYSYSKSSIMPSSKARFGGGATTAAGSSASLTLSNKLQTKRKGQSIDLVDFNATTSYAIKPKTEDKRGSSLSDFLFELKLLPYSWLRIDADTTYKHTDRYSANYRHFSNINYDINFDFGKERSFAVGQRYLRKGGNEITYDLNWRLNPKWRFSIYQRRNIGHDPTLKRGLREQEYSISRDLHCWTWDITYNIKRGYGESIWFVFRLKAFPEIEFEFDQQYHQPKPGSQSNP